MATYFDRLYEWIEPSLRNFGVDTDLSGTELFFDILYPIALITFIALGAYLFIRWIKYQTSYAGDGEPYGGFRITIQGLTTVTGNLSQHYFISDSEYELLKSLPNKDLAETIQSFRKRVEDGELFIYDFKITDYFESSFDLKGGKDSIIVSPVDLNSEVFNWIDIHGERSLISPTGRMKHRNVACFAESRYYPDQAMPHRVVDIYELVPIPKKLIPMKIDEINQAVLYLNKLGGAKADAILAEYLITISEYWMGVKPMQVETDRLREENREKDRIISDALREGERDRHMAFTNPIIGFKKGEIEFNKPNTIAMLCIMMLVGGFVAMLPELMGISISGFLFLFAGVGVAFALLYMMLENKKPDKTKESRLER